MATDRVGAYDVADWNRRCDERDLARIPTRLDIGRMATLCYLIARGRTDLDTAAFRAERAPDGVGNG